MELHKSFNCILFAAIMIILSCGSESGRDIQSKCTIDTTDAVAIGPVFVLISNTDDLNKIKNDPTGSVLSIINVEDNGEFDIDINGTGINIGDVVYLVAFVDNDYTGGIPEPTPGDYVGFYINESSLQTAYTIKKLNNDIHIKINREVFDFTASIEGTVTSSDSGELTIIAYSGKIDSLDISSLNFKDIIAYKKFQKPVGVSAYSLDVMPYGKNVPISDVLVIALLDMDGDGIPGDGDRLGFYRTATDHMPQAITVNAGITGGIDIEITKRVYDFTTPLSFKFNTDNHPAGFSAGSNFIALVVHEDGVNTSTQEVDADYVMGMSSLTYNSDSSYVYSFNLYNFFDEDIGLLSSGDAAGAYVFAIYDSNNDGLPSEGEDIAAYWRWLFGYYPKVFTLTLDSSNTLSNPDNVRFINMQM